MVKQGKDYALMKQTERERDVLQTRACVLRTDEADKERKGCGKLGRATPHHQIRIRLHVCGELMRQTKREWKARGVGKPSPPRPTRTALVRTADPEENGQKWEVVLKERQRAKTVCMYPGG